MATFENGQSPELLRELSALGTATIHEAMGQRGSISPRIMPLDPAVRLVGPALTVDAGWADNLMIHAALERVRSGEVLVVDSRGCEEAGVWGDLLTAQAQHRGVAGLVVDGVVRDTEAIVNMAFPTFARGACIRGTTKTYRGMIGAPVTVGGVVVETGDLIVGDRDGLVVVPAAEVDECLDAARARAVREEEVRKALAEGRSTVELLGLRHAVAELGLAPRI